MAEDKPSVKAVEPEPLEPTQRTILVWLSGLVLTTTLIALFMDWDLSYAGLGNSEEGQGHLARLISVIALGSFACGFLMSRSETIVALLACPGPWVAFLLAFLKPTWALAVVVLGTGSGFFGRVLGESWYDEDQAQAEEAPATEEAPAAGEVAAESEAH